MWGVSSAEGYGLDPAALRHANELRGRVAERGLESGELETPRLGGGPATVVELSEIARDALSGGAASDDAADSGPDSGPDSDASEAGLDASGSRSASSSAGGEQELTREQEEQVRELKDRDSEVRAHENAHAAVGGQYAGSPSYTYQTGPDGGRYAIGGEVPIDVSDVPGEPEKTIAKMQVVRAAAMAPAEPSAADRQVAAQASAKMAEAYAELRAQSTEPGADAGEAPDSASASGPANANPGAEEEAAQARSAEPSTQSAPANGAASRGASSYARLAAATGSQAERASGRLLDLAV